MIYLVGVSLDYFSARPLPRLITLVGLVSTALMAYSTFHPIIDHPARWSRKTQLADFSMVALGWVYLFIFESADAQPPAWFSVIALIGLSALTVGNFVIVRQGHRLSTKPTDPPDARDENA